MTLEAVHPYFPVDLHLPEYVALQVRGLAGLCRALLHAASAAAA